jgi:hypothetical protein
VRRRERQKRRLQAPFALRFGIAGSTTETQKGIIGERLLGLPN